MAIMTAREKLLREMKLLMGGGMVNVELTPDHYDLALDIAFERYRLRAANSYEERYALLQLQVDQQSYTLPNEVVEVRKLFRRGMGNNISSSGPTMDPFSTALSNQFLLTNSRGGGILTYELFAGFSEIVGRMFGSQLLFVYNPTSHELNIERNFRGAEDVVIWFSCYRPDEVLLSDNNARIWLRDYATARAKFMLGEIRGKFQSIAGPQGGSALNGESLKTEAQAEMERLEEELKRLVGSKEGYGFIIG